MEEYGYINDLEKNNLINELENKGIDRNKLNISGSMTKQAYGEPISLNIEYEYISKIHSITRNYSIDKREKGIPIIIEKKSFSKI